MQVSFLLSGKQQNVKIKITPENGSLTKKHSSNPVWWSFLLQPPAHSSVVNYFSPHAVSANIAAETRIHTPLCIYNTHAPNTAHLKVSHQKICNNAHLQTSSNALNRLTAPGRIRRTAPRQSWMLLALTLGKRSAAPPGPLSWPRAAGPGQCGQTHISPHFCVQ